MLLLTATQNIAQRGHRDSDDSHNKGHFLTILEEIATYDHLIEKRMNACGNAKYTKPPNSRTNFLRAELRWYKVTFLRVIVDETKDLKEKITNVFSCEVLLQLPSTKAFHTFSQLKA
jgi:hypothetical protein